ncbi:MAG: ATP-binding cassette domain-containing protein [Anaerococcus sp.]|nr:ATP-binding cassette domain-containing protein [Anaerococcus sp.]
MSFFEFDRVSFETEDKKIIKDMSFEVKKGDYISIKGPSGSGKSTLLRLACNLISPSSGKIIYKDRDYLEYKPEDLRKDILYSSQSSYLFGKKVSENISYLYKLRNLEVDKKRVDYLFDRFKMSTKFLDKDVDDLSGGERQRISLIRSLIFLPEIILLDEVTSALDIDNKNLVREIIRDLNKDGLTVLSISHDVEERKEYNKILVVEDGKLASFKEVGNEHN